MAETEDGYIILFIFYRNQEVMCDLTDRLMQLVIQEVRLHSLVLRDWREVQGPRA